MVTSENVIDVLKIAMAQHMQNVKAIRYLKNYYLGDQAILYREKQVRPEINNKLVCNHAFEIVQFKLGDLFADSVQYAYHSRKDSSVTDDEACVKVEYVSKLNEYMRMANRAYIDKALGEMLLINGTAYKAIYPTGNPKQPFLLKALDPESTFIVYSAGVEEKPLCSVQIIPMGDNAVLSVYTPSEYFEVDTANTIIKNVRHGLGGIPVIEYPMNALRIGAFEPVITLLDAINKTMSDRVNGVEQFIQALIKFINCDVDNDLITRIKETMCVNVHSTDGQVADVEILSQELDQTQVQHLLDDIYQKVLIICGIPNRNAPTTTSGDTGHAVVLRDGWADAEVRTKDTINCYEMAERELVKLAIRIVKDYEPLDLEVADVDSKFHRDRSENLLVKTQGLLNMFRLGVHPRRCLNEVNLFSDPDDVYLESKPYMERLWGSDEVAPINGTQYENGNAETNTLGSNWHKLNENTVVD